MQAEKHSIVKSESGYVVSAGRIAGEERILIAGEGKEPAMAVDPASLSVEVLSTDPGGCMGFAEYPDRGDALFMITKFYPIFQSEEAGIDLCTMGSDDPGSWSNRRIIDLPFLHRIVSVKTEAGNYLFASTVCGGKDFQDDWSKPGTVYVIEIPSSPEGPWTPVPILENLHRNHGMTMRMEGGLPRIIVSADEGVFEIPVRKNPENEWTWNRILDRSISELRFIDMDGDGRDEMVTIEPFHGDTLRIYRQTGDSWLPLAESELSFGHGLSVGSIRGLPVATVGNRSGSRDLLVFRMTGEHGLERTVLDSDTGTAGTAVFNSNGVDLIVASNQEQSEYAAYIFKEGAL